MTSQTAPTGIIFKTDDGTNLAPKDNNGNTENLALPLPPNNSKFDIYIDAALNGNFTISTDQDVDIPKNKNIVFYSNSDLDHLWTWSSSTSGVDRWISSNYVYNFNMTVSCFSYNYGEKFNLYENWNEPATDSAQFSPGFTFDKNNNYDGLILANYGAGNKTGDIDISGLFSGTSECTSIYLLDNNNEVTSYSSKSDFIDALNQLN